MNDKKTRKWFWFHHIKKHKTKEWNELQQDEKNNNNNIKINTTTKKIVERKLVFGFEYVMKSVQTFWQRPTRRRLQYIKWNVWNAILRHTRKRISKWTKNIIKKYTLRRRGNKSAIYIWTTNWKEIPWLTLTPPLILASTSTSNSRLYSLIEKTKNYLTSWSADRMNSDNNNMHGRIFMLYSMCKNASIHIFHRHIRA